MVAEILNPLLNNVKNQSDEFALSTIVLFVIAIHTRNFNKIHLCRLLCSTTSNWHKKCSRYLFKALLHNILSDRMAYYIVAFSAGQGPILNKIRRI